MKTKLTALAILSVLTMSGAWAYPGPGLFRGHAPWYAPSGASHGAGPWHQPASQL